jgi:acetyl esterase/lipase
MSANDQSSPSVIARTVAGCLTGVAAAAFMPGAESAPVAPSAVIDVWPAGAMPGKPADLPEALQPSKGDNVDRITNVSHPTLSLFRAAPATKPTPVLIICPGGGYGILAFNKEGTDIAAWLAANGITAVVLKYRVPGNRDGAFQDIQRAIRVVRQHAQEWNIDPARVGVMGFSAGGHLCARLSTDPTQVAYPAVDGADALPTRPDFAVLVYPAYLEHGGALPPELPVSAQNPPTILIHTDDDHAFIAGSRVFHAALDAAGVANEFACYPTGGHGYGLRSTAAVQVWPERVLAWLTQRGLR